MMIKFPKISIVTPSFNQAEFLEQAILSVLEQNYPNLEYIVIDGNSTDNSVEIIKKYEKHLSYWVSEKDDGQYHALNKGFGRSTGEIMGWLNSDDMYCRSTLKTVANIFETITELEWVTSLFPITWNRDGSAVDCFQRPFLSRDAFYEGRYSDIFPGKALRYIQQESTFWKKSLWKRSGSRLSDNFSLAGDFELWARFYESGKLAGVSVPLGGFRIHPNQRSHLIEEYRNECFSILSRYKPSHMRVLRDTAKCLHLDNMPILNRLIHKLIGYDFMIVHAELKNKRKEWVVTNGKKLF